MQEYKVNIQCFNTDLKLVLKGKESIEEVIGLIIKTATILHNSFNIYDEKSEISKLNKEKKIIASKYLYDILKVSQKYELLTNYHFNTNQTFEIRNNFKFCSKVVAIKSEIDLGGIAKGYFMRLLKDYLDNQKIDYEINFGGALLFSINRNIEIRNPNNPTENMIRVNMLAGECIHTSSFYYQIEGENSHIHQRGMGYKKQNKSVSIISENPIIADVFSTAMYSMEVKEALEYAKRLNLKMLYATNKELYISSSIENYEILIDDIRKIII